MTSMTFFRTLAIAGAALAASLGMNAAFAQGQPDPLPARVQADANGVDLVSGELNLSATDVVIGQPGAGGLAYGRSYAGEGWRSSALGSIVSDGSTYFVSLGGSSDEFTESGGSFTSAEGAGATLTYSSGSDEYTYTTADGAVAVFDGGLAGELGGINVEPGMNCEAILVSVTAPTGATTTYNYRTVTVSSEEESRLQSVTNSFGFMLHFDYARDADPASSGDLDSWRELDVVTGINLAVDYCAATAATCSGFTETWPTASYTGPTDRPLTVTDAESRTTTYTYDGDDRLSTIKWPAASSANVTFTYHATGDCVGCVKKVDRNFADWDYTYADASGERTTTVALPGGGNRVVKSTNSTGLIDSDKDPLNREALFTYDSSGRVTEVEAPEGNKTQYAYDSRGNVTQTTRVPKSGSGLSNIVTSASYPGSCSNQKTCNKPTSTTNARGKITDYTYDSTHGGVTSVKAPDPDGGGSLPRPESRFFYAQKQARYKDGASSFTNGAQTYVLTSTSACASSAFDGAYNSSAAHANNDCSAGDDDETVASIAWPGTGSAQNLQPDSVTAEAEDSSVTSTTSFAYDAFARLEFTDGPLSGSDDKTRFLYNGVGQQIGVIGPDPDGAGSLKHPATRTSYASSGLPFRVEQGTVNGYLDSDWSSLSALQKVESEYDDHYRPVKGVVYSDATSTVLQLTQTSYDSAGRPECVALRMNPSVFGSPPSSACSLGTTGTYGADRIVKREYNLAGQVTKTKTAQGTSLAQDTVTTTYTTNGRVETVTDANGNKTTYEYDGFDRLKKTRLPHPTSAGTSSTTDYEELTWSDASGTRGLVTARRMRDARSITYTYDDLGRMTQKSVPGSGANPAFDYEYDNFGRLTYDAHGAKTRDFAWDALGRLVSVDHDSSAKVFSYDYDAAGRLTELVYPDGFDVDYTYDLLNRVKTAVEGSTTLASVTYDDRGRRASLTYANGASVDYGFDGAGRLDELDWDLNGSGDDFSYDFSFNPASQAVSLTVSDASLNWAPAGVFTEDYVANGLNQYTDVGTAEPVHDSAGNVATDHRGQTYLYTAENVLKEATVSGTNYKYGLYGDNMRSNTNIAGVGAQGYFYYDPFALAGLPQEIAEYDGGDSGLVRRYIRLPGAVDEVILMIDYTLDDCSSSYAACEVWAHHDRLGSTVATSDSAGNEIDNYTYSHFGESGPEGDSGFPFRFTGQKIDAETGLYYYKARHYDPETGRFMQTDPIGFAGGMNLYAYVGNDPGNAIDPIGLDTIVVTGPKKDCWPSCISATSWDALSYYLANPIAVTLFDPTDANNFIGAGSDSGDGGNSDRTRSNSRNGTSCGGGQLTASDVYKSTNDWIVQWQLGSPSQKGGYVIQQVRITGVIYDSNGNPGRVSQVFWEAFRVDPGSSIAIHDDRIYAGPDFSGNVRVTTSARFHEGLKLPSSFTSNNPNTTAGAIPSTTQNPRLGQSNATCSVNRSTTLKQ